MGTDTATAMDAVEISDFLEDQKVGVLSLADDDDSYAIPVSFTYDDRSLYFRLGFAPGSQKRRFLDAVGQATFVVYAHNDEGWTSVVAGGDLEELTNSNIDASIEESVRNLDIPFFKVHDRPADDLQFSIVRMNANRLNGIVEGGH